MRRRVIGEESELSGFKVLWEPQTYDETQYISKNFHLPTNAKTIRVYFDRLVQNTSVYGFTKTGQQAAIRYIYFTDYTKQFYLVSDYRTDGMDGFIGYPYIDIDVENMDIREINIYTYEYCACAGLYR